MSLEFCLLLTSKLLALSMLVQACEYLSLSKKKSFRKIWSYENLKNDFEVGLPLPTKILSRVFSNNAFFLINVLQFAVAAFIIFFSHHQIFFVLFITHLYNCIRFRGNFNGGSDMMTFVVLIGLLISYSSVNQQVQKLGLIFISIHLFYSYLKAGLVKIFQSEWRNGSALPIFLNRSHFADSKSFATWLKKHINISASLCWLVLIFEISFFVTLFHHQLIYFYFLFAMTFHLLVYLSFGLNRFFWIWFSAWPALIYTIKF